MLNTRDDTAGDWSYTTTEPAGGWMRTDFDASQWSKGPAGFGRADTRWGHVGIRMDDQRSLAAADVRSADGPSGAPAPQDHHDDGAEVYVNGELAATLPGATGGYMFVPMSEASARAFHSGPNTLAVHVHQERGGQYIDVGIVDVVEK